MKKHRFLIFTLVAMPLVLLTTDYASVSGRITAVLAGAAIALSVVVTRLDSKRKNA